MVHVSLRDQITSLVKKKELITKGKCSPNLDKFWPAKCKKELCTTPTFVLNSKNVLNERLVELKYESH